MSKGIRQSNIELLRIYAIASVIVLHYLNSGIGGGTNYLRGTASVLIGRLLLSVSFCAVDLFIMVSGYFLSTSSKRSLSKVVFLLFDAAVLRSIIYIVNSLINSTSITAVGLLKCIVSVGYFIVFYVIVYCLSPLINTAFGRLDKKSAQKAVVIIFVLFSVISSTIYFLKSKSVLNIDWTSLSTVTKEGSFEGYSIVNFFVCYIIGGFIRHWQAEKVKIVKVAFLLAANTVVLTAWGYIDWLSAYTYDNPLVIIEAAFLLLLFGSFSFKSKFINELATSGFTCYLVHSTFLKYAGIEKFASREWYVFLAHILITTAAIYFICYLIHRVYKFCTGWFVKTLSPIIDRIDISLIPKEN